MNGLSHQTTCCCVRMESVSWYYLKSGRKHYQCLIKVQLRQCSIKQEKKDTLPDRRVKADVSLHCLAFLHSPGTGRTGTFLASDIVMKQFEEHRTIDVPRTVYAIRRDRAGAVQTKEQYAFIYRVRTIICQVPAGLARSMGQCLSVISFLHRRCYDTFDDNNNCHCYLLVCRCDVLSAG